MKIPVPFLASGNRLVVTAELDRPKGGVIADAKRVADGGDLYSSILTFLAGTVSQLEGPEGAIEGQANIRQALRSIPYQSSDFLALHALALTGVDDKIETYCRCPRCKKQIQDQGVRLQDLEIKFYEPHDGETEPRPVVRLQYPVEITNRKTGEILLRVEEVKLRYPCLEDCIVSFRAVGMADQMRLQYRIWLEAIEAVNGEAVDAKWRNEIGVMIFDRMDIVDLKAISASLREYGMAQTVKIRCPSCGKEFEQGVSTADFFAYGLGESE